MRLSLVPTVDAGQYTSQPEVCLDAGSDKGDGRRAAEGRDKDALLAAIGGVSIAWGHPLTTGYSSSTTGARLTRGSVNTSLSSRLVLENSETIAPWSPPWNQCNVFAAMVCCAPGFSSISWRTV